MKWNPLTFLTIWAKFPLSLLGSPASARVRDAREEPWPTMRMTPGTPGKEKKGGKGPAALPCSPSAQGDEVALGLFILAGLFDNVPEHQKISGVLSISAIEWRHLWGKEKKAFQESVSSFAEPTSWCRKTKKSIYFFNLVVYCLSFILLFSFLSHKLLVCYSSVAQCKHWVCHKLCAVPTAHIKRASVGKSLPAPVTASVWQNIQRPETFTFAGAGTGDVFYNCRASADIVFITFRWHQRREWEVSPDNKNTNVC